MVNPTRRVVVTGMGAVSPLGLTLEETWAGLTAGKSGVARVSHFDASGHAVQIAAEVKGFDAIASFGKRRARHMDRFVQLALVATTEAVESSKLDIAGSPERVGVVYGTGIGGIVTLETGMRTLMTRGPEWVNPYTCPMMIPNMAAGQIAIDWGILGPNTATVTACAASAQAIGEAYDQIRLGRADAMVCGGAEAAVSSVGIAGFASMKALSVRNDEPERASRPFDANRDGFVLGEGAATLVLEERDSAMARGADILAEIVGYGSTCDAYHMTQPDPSGSGARRAMLAALSEAGYRPEDISYINAHGTSTPPNDRIESLAIRQVFGAHAPPVSSTKSMTGHLLGASGALEAAISILVIRTGILPPTINYETPDPECDLDYVPNVARNAEVNAVMTNSFGFGGHNASLIFARAI
jgi:3-oxoacyl-[acyl-carrier-protein] synthase II